MATSREAAARNEKTAHDAEAAERKEQTPDASTNTDEPVADHTNDADVIVPSPEPREPQNPQAEATATGFQAQSENAPVDYIRVSHPGTGVETEVTEADFKNQFEREGFKKVGK